MDAPYSTLFGSARIELETLYLVESKLELFEKISLIFLLYNEPVVAEEHIHLLIESNNMAPQILHDWARNYGDRWKEMLVETLLIIQAYEDLSRLDLDVPKLKDHFLPHVLETSLFVHPLKKVLYSICEAHTKDETKELIERLYSSCPNVVRNVYDFKYMELVFLKLIRHKYISLGSMKDSLKSSLDTSINLFCNVDIIKKCLDIPKFSRFQNSLSSVENCVNKESVAVDKNLIESIIKNGGTSSAVSSSSSNSESIIGQYRINDAKNLGFFIIINQKKYEKSNEYQLEERLGTDFDVKRLKDCWTKYGFTVELLENLRHNEIIPKIETFIKKVSNHHSIFALCILSHGQKDIIFGSDSKPLQIDKIKAVFYSNGDKLYDRPKLLIVQACRGEETMRHVCVSNPSLKIDSPRSHIVMPEAADLMIFWATVANYVSYRDTTKGSWFIETLCDCLMKHGDKLHLSDLFTLVNNELSEKKIQISQFESTWRKTFKLALVEHL